MKEKKGREGNFLIKGRDLSDKTIETNEIGPLWLRIDHSRRSRIKADKTVWKLL